MAFIPHLKEGDFPPSRLKDAYDMLTSGTPIPTTSEPFDFINRNSKNARHITREELRAVLSGNPIDEERFFTHIRKCDHCNNVYMNAHENMNYQKPKGFFGKAQEFFGDLFN